ncbi:MAG: hypothetical protein LBC09_00855, partial [Helicobacteraceae bacterium]|nr:hypothetical protein [Helicobacteraceae bacterium]
PPETIDECRFTKLVYENKNGCRPLTCREDYVSFSASDRDCENLYCYIKNTEELGFGGMMGEASLNITDLSITRFFPQTKLLALYNTSTPDISFVKNLPNLEAFKSLDINIKSLEPLKDLNMTNIKITTEESANSAILDFAALSNMKRLKSLEFRGKHNGDLAPLAKLTALERLEIVASSKIKDICALNELVNLNTLIVSYSNTNDIACLKKLKKLTVFGIMDSNVKSVNAIADQFPNLEWLFLEGNPIADLTPLAKLEKLYDVWVDTENLLPCSPKSVEEIKAGVACKK